MFYIIAYDIPCNQRRKKISDLLEGYGRRVQYSVFECDLAADKFPFIRGINCLETRLLSLRSRVKIA